MQTLKQQLEQITTYYSNYIEIVENYKCGFITGNEMQHQIEHVSKLITDIKTNIAIEYNINEHAIDLMLAII